MSINNLTERIYYDVIITNTNKETVGPQPIYFSEARSIPVLYQPNKYCLSIVRWTV